MLRQQTDLISDVPIRMNKIRTFWLALIVGVLTETLLWVAIVNFGGFGPCGPANDFSVYYFVVHLPAMRIADKIMPDSFGGRGAFTFVATTALFALVAYFPIASARALCQRKCQFGLGSLVGFLAVCAVVFAWLTNSLHSL